MVVSNTEKTAWVHGYLRAYLDILTTMGGYDPKTLADGTQFIAEETLRKLKVPVDDNILRVIRGLDDLEIQLTINHVISKNTPKTFSKFSIVF